MRNHLKYLALILSLLIVFTLSPQPDKTVSQDEDTCTQIVEQALQAIGSACAELGRNEACYGHVNVQATFRAGIEAQFENNGDIVAIGDLESLITQAVDPSTEAWGVALLSLQADLPDDSTESVTFVLFGDAEITSAVSEGRNDEFTAPMQAVTLRSGDTDTCEQARDGLLIRSPKGRRARVMVNGVELTLSSAVFITAEADADMGIQGLEGEIEVTAEEHTEVVTPGFISTVSLDDDFEPDAPPTAPEPVEEDDEFPFDEFEDIFPEDDCAEDDDECFEDDLFDEECTEDDEDCFEDDLLDDECAEDDEDCFEDDFFNEECPEDDEDCFEDDYFDDEFDEDDFDEEEFE